MTNPNYSIAPTYSNSSFDLTSDEYIANGITFAITFVCKHCVIVESAHMVTGQPCRSRAAAEKFCELEAKRIAARVQNWVTIMLARLIASIAPQPSAPVAIALMPQVRIAAASDTYNENIIPTEANLDCDGYMNAHWNLPKGEWNTPASTRRGTRNLCEHCAAAYDKANAVYERANKPAPALTYIKYTPAA